MIPKIPVMMMTPDRIIQMMILTQFNWMMTQMRYFLTTSWLQLLKLGNLEKLALNIFPRFGESVMKMPKGPLMSLPKCPFKQMIQPYPGITLPMIGCSGTKGSRTFSSWIPSLQPRKVVNHQEAYLLSTFVTEKGFIYVVPMKKKSEVLLAIKQFAKEIGAPDSFVADMSGEQMSSEVKIFGNEIGATL